MVQRGVVPYAFATWVFSNRNTVSRPAVAEQIPEASMATQTDLSGKVVVITGASSGFGRGAALEFASAGASVVLAARRGEALDTVARECETAGGTAIPVSVDVSSERDVEQLAE